MVPEALSSLTIKVVKINLNEWLYKALLHDLVQFLLSVGSNEDPLITGKTVSVCNYPLIKHSLVLM